jgi:N-acetylglutamate synthase/N-acetylornithine aminotransferase
MTEWKTKMVMTGNVKLSELHESTPFVTEYVTLAEAEEALTLERSALTPARLHAKTLAERSRIAAIVREVGAARSLTGKRSAGTAHAVCDEILQRIEEKA